MNRRQNLPSRSLVPHLRRGAGGLALVRGVIGRVFVFAPKVAAVAILAATLALAAATNAWWEHVPAKDHGRSNPLATQTDAVTAGGLLYRDHCLQCHKADAQGDGRKKPSLRTDRIRAVTDGDLEWFLRQGNLGHGMPSWSSLPEAQRWQLIIYLRSLQ